MLLSPNQIKWLQSPKGKIWLKTSAGQNWLAKNKTNFFFSSDEKEKPLSKDSQAWCYNSQGYFWLKAFGNTWLETSAGQEWLANIHGQTWLKTTGKKWLTSQQGQAWLEVPARLKKY